MTSWKIIMISNVVLIHIAVAVIVSAEPRFIKMMPRERKPSCLRLEQSCMKSKLPCCSLNYQNTYLKLGQVQTTCFQFGKGICQVNQSIENFNEYSKLIKHLNGTNFQELKDKYWNSIPTVYTCPRKITIEMKSG